MPREDLPPQPGEPLGRRPRALVASADREAEPERQLRYAAHAGAADAEEMQAALTGEQSLGERCTHAAARSLGPSSKHNCAMMRAASGLAALRAPAPFRTSCGGSAISSQSPAARFSPSRSSS